MEISGMGVMSRQCARELSTVENRVTTIWELEEHATAHLMTVFYEHLGRAEEKGESLREAQLQMLASGDPPYFWAGFEVVGDPSGSLFKNPNLNSTFRSNR